MFQSCASAVFLGWDLILVCTILWAECCLVWTVKVAFNERGREREREKESKREIDRDRDRVLSLHLNPEVPRKDSINSIPTLE